VLRERLAFLQVGLLHAYILPTSTPACCRKATTSTPIHRSPRLTAALRQHAKPIVIEDQELARQFARLLRLRELGLWALGEFVADTMSHAIGRSYGANIEAHWYVGQYVLPGNVQKVILKPKPYDAERLPRHLQTSHCCERR
jgi:hypothetical protein